MLPQFSRLGPVSYLRTLLHNHFFKVDEEQSYSDLILFRIKKNILKQIFVYNQKICATKQDLK